MSKKNFVMQTLQCNLKIVHVLENVFYCFNVKNYSF